MNVISIHAPRGGSDLDEAPRPPLPVRDFNPRSPRGERRPADPDMCPRTDFNPRSPRGERPCTFFSLMRDCRYFNPRSPRGERRPVDPDMCPRT